MIGLAVLAVLAADARSIAELLPADTAVVIACDDVPALRAAVATLDVAEALAREDEHAPLRTFLAASWRELVAAAWGGDGADALAAAPIRRAFVACVPDDDGDAAWLVGVEGAGESLAAVRAPEGNERPVAMLGDWTFVAGDESVVRRPLDVATSKEPALAHRARFVDTSAVCRDSPAPHAWAWMDRDVWVALVLPFFGSGRPAVDAPKELGAMAWRARVEDGRIASTLFNEFGAAPSLLRVDAPRAFEADWLALVPRGARGFAWMQGPLAAAAHAAAVAGGDGAGEEAALLADFASSLGRRVLVIATTDDDGVDTRWEAWIELADADAFARDADAAVEHLERAIAEDWSTGRFQRDDGRVIRELTLRDTTVPCPRSAWWTQAGRWIVATTRAERLDAMIERAEDPSREAADVRSDARFAAAFERLSARIPEVHGVSCVDAGATLANATDAIVAAVRAIRPRSAAALDEAGLRALAALLAAQGQSVAVTWHAPHGLVTEREGFPLGEASLAWCVLPNVATRLPQALRAQGAVQTTNTRREAIRMDLERVAEAVRRYERDHSELPAQLDTLLRADPRNFGQPYLDDERRLQDPWGRRFHYRATDSGEFRITCLGADGRRGGVGADADVRIVGP